MTTTTEIIQDAFRESNVIRLGASPTSDMQTEAMSRLNNLISAVYGDDVGENFQDWMVGYEGQINPNYSWTQLQWSYPIINSRILLNHNEAQTLYLPLRPYDGSRIQVIDVQGVLATYNVTLDGNGRNIETTPTITLNTNDLNRTWIFDAEAANWERAAATFAIGDQMPFPTEFDDYFIIKLAGRLNPRYGRSLSEESVGRLAEMQDMLESKYRQRKTMPAQKGVRRLSDPNQRFFFSGNWRGRWGWM